MSVWLDLYGDAGIRIDAEGVDENLLVEGFSSLFVRRYLPIRRALASYPGESFSRIQWRPSDGFRVVEYSLGDRDVYRVESGVPEPYRREQPVFFTLQVAAREYARRGLLLLTDTVAIPRPDGRAVLVLGYPHGGKSTLAALAATRGYMPLSTENTVLAIAGDGTARVLGGTRVLVYDPRALARYTVEKLEPDDTTRHGYYVVDLDARNGLREATVEAIYLVHCSLVSTGVSVERITGRKALKTLWHFATALVRGDDYYDPHPLNLATPDVDEQISQMLRRMASRYQESFYEVFGSHDRVLELMMQH